MGNSIMTIKPYKENSVWVFDEEKFNIQKEPFVCGMNEIIDEILKQNYDKENPDNGFNCVFSNNMFPDYQEKLTFIKEEMGGAWYIHEKTNMKGWLCPVLYTYFEKSPKEIFIKVF